MKSITKKAYGKINLILKVGKKMENGKHDVLTVMTKVGIYDTVKVTEVKENGINIECDEQTLANKDNLAFKAAERYFDAAGFYRNIKISIKKRIPVAAGMGGGSSDAGAVLNALEEIYGLLGFTKIYEIASGLGSDVPFFIFDDKTMLGRGTGTELTPFPTFTDDFYGVFILSDAPKKSTAEMYRLLDIKRSGIPDDTYGAEEQLKKAIKKGDIKIAVQCFFNDFELCNKHITDLRKIFSEYGAEKTILCGSGPTVCGIYTDKEKAEKALKELSYKSFICKL